MSVVAASPCPEVPFWNLTLRFGLEIAALIGLSVAAAARFSTSAAVAAPVFAGVAWGLYNVPGDSSRSGKAAMPVPGIVRLAIELLVLFGAAWALIAVGHSVWGWLLAGLITLHLAFSIPRVRWLLGLWPGTETS